MAGQLYPATLGSKHAQALLWISKAIRDAIDGLLDARAADDRFQARLQAAVERNREAPKLLAN